MFHNVIEGFGKLLVVLGITLAAIGGLLIVGQRVSWMRFGRLPGDISFERDGFGLYIPFTSMLILSALVSLVLWVIARLRA